MIDRFRAVEGEQKFDNVTSLMPTTKPYSKHQNDALPTMARPSTLQTLTSTSTVSH
jgi:hypothetical protein